MLTEFIITFRETLEASLIVGIILAYLAQTHGRKHFQLVFWATLSAIGASILAAAGFQYLAGGFEGIAEEIFEGIVMITASILLGSLLIWMMQQKHNTVKLRASIDKKIHAKHTLGLFALVFFSVFREGIEMVIFLAAAATAYAEHSLFGSIAGIASAALLGYLIYIGIKLFNLKHFFTFSTLILLLFGAGLFAHGIHELQEAGIFPALIDHVWDINPPVHEDGSYPLFHEKGLIGSHLVALFGYNGNPSLLEIMGYLLYLGGLYFLSSYLIRKPIIAKGIQ